MILEGEAEGNNNYFVIITDENGNVIPDATLTSEHIGECFTAVSYTHLDVYKRQIQILMLSDSRLLRTIVTLIR